MVSGHSQTKEDEEETCLQLTCLPGFQSAPSALQHLKIEESNGDVIMTSPDRVHSTVPSRANAKDGFDGMNALLRAGEIVGRRHGE